MTPTDAARAILRNHGEGYRGQYDRDFIIAIARALLDAEEREREYRSAIINVIEGCHMSTAGINILQSALDHDEPTGKAGA